VTIADYTARGLLDALAKATDEDLADPLQFGPWTRATYREIGIDLDSPEWRDELPSVRARYE
jgi:hypothetical protein